MSDVAIRVEGLGKEYRIGARAEKYKTFRDSLTGMIGAPVQRIRNLVRGQRLATDRDESFWALKDISFEVQRGEVVGIIGRNGAGKSTLLKILSRITEPTVGRAMIYGRVGALLEVGTGFHPELTGRENIYLNAAILGMKRYEIDRKFDEIVAFAEIDKFIDTAVKHYSSGMGLRLGFAVAAHLEPEILIVDEVLAVGDAAFQQKCLGKMSDVAGEGRTVLFVSHNMTAVSNLCTSTVLLQSGKLVMNGPTHDVINFYTSALRTQTSTELHDRQDRNGNGAARFTKITLKNAQHKETDAILCGESFDIELDYESMGKTSLTNVSVSVIITNSLGDNLVCLWDQASNGGSLNVNLSKQGTLVCHINSMQLMPGNYFLTLNMTQGKQSADKIEYAAILSVIDNDFFGSGKLPPAHTGNFLMPNSWSYLTNRE